MSGEDRQSELAREHKERQEQRAAQAAKAKRNTVIGAGVAVVAVVGGIIAATAVLGSSDAGKPEAAASPTPSASTSAPASTAPSIAPTAPPKKAGPVSCTYKKDTADVPKKFVGFPPSKPSLKWKTMKIVTNIGDVEIAVDPAVTPCTLNSFAFLAKKNFYDNTPCYRYVTPDVSGLHLMQCGDPLAKGDGKNKTDGQGTAGYVYGDENLGMPIVEGIVFMAQAGEDKGQNNSQFVFSLSNDNTQIPADYTTFGMVTKGLDVMKAVAKNQDDLVINEGDITGNGGATAPKKPVIIKDLQLLTK
ncbi:peptidylprolyl isomerase [Nonomuraea sp. NPDC046570]|uniref:peptidylprolyl isomerase n=1 Tax=Nonomuraea sp. NPDC046570 TaxID=3155255 RepID=UPI0033CF12AD